MGGVDGDIFGQTIATGVDKQLRCRIPLGIGVDDVQNLLEFKGIVTKVNVH